jgi:hypothetical protein
MTIYSWFSGTDDSSVMNDDKELYLESEILRLRNKLNRSSQMTETYRILASEFQDMQIKQYRAPKIDLRTIVIIEESESDSEEEFSAAIENYWKKNKP